ncbi:unnamed protein product, partial [marine sediment metagenome]
RKITKAITNSDFFIVCLTKNSYEKRGYLQREIKQALDIWQEKLEDDIYLFPARLEECDVHQDLQDFQWVNLYEDDGWDRLFRAIQAGISRRQAKGDKVENSERIALVVNAFTGEELTACKNDSTRIYTMLTRRDLGNCSRNSPGPYLDCKNRNEFLNYFINAMKKWTSRNQLIFYFSGHGCFMRDQCCFMFGERNEDTLPFKNIMNDLDANGVNRAIMIIDACFSAEGTGIKNKGDILNIKQDEIPKGIVVLASSRGISHES